MLSSIPWKHCTVAQGQVPTSYVACIDMHVYSGAELVTWGLLQRWQLQQSSPSRDIPPAVSVCYVCLRLHKLNVQIPLHGGGQLVVNPMALSQHVSTLRSIVARAEAINPIYAGCFGSLTA